MEEDEASRHVLGNVRSSYLLLAETECIVGYLAVPTAHRSRVSGRSKHACGRLHSWNWSNIWAAAGALSQVLKNLITDILSGVCVCRGRGGHNLNIYINRTNWPPKCTFELNDTNCPTTWPPLNLVGSTKHMSEIM